MEKGCISSHLMLNQPLVLLAGNCKSQSATCFPDEAKRGWALCYFTTISHQGLLVWGTEPNPGSASESRCAAITQVTARAPRRSPNPGSDLSRLCFMCHTYLLSEVAHMKYQKNLAKFTANAAFRKQGLAKKVWLGVYVYICTKTSTAFPSSFESMLSAKLQWKIRSHKGVHMSRRSHWAGACRQVIFSAHRWGHLNRIPAGTCQLQPPGSTEEGWVPEPPASTKEGHNKPIWDIVLGSIPNSSPCSDLAGLRFPSLVSCLKRLGRTHEGI